MSVATKHFFQSTSKWAEPEYQAVVYLCAVLCRYNWPVDRYGKWAELGYQADVYPPFACGTASLLSADVVRWLARNTQELVR